MVQCLRALYAVRGTKFGLTRSISNVSENVKPLVSLKAHLEAEKKDHAKSGKEISP